MGPLKGSMLTTSAVAKQVATDAAEALFRVIDAVYEKRSIAISSNMHPRDL
jgi:hypothetical protein